MVKRLADELHGKIRESITPDLQLLEGEELKLKLRPHVLAFYNLYLIWLFVVGLSGVFLFLNEYLSDFISERTGLVGLIAPFSGHTPSILSGVGLIRGLSQIISTPFSFFLYNDNPAGLILLGIWFTIITLAATTVSVVRISWRWIPILLSVLLASAALTFIFRLPYEAAYVIAIIFSILGVIGVELFRRGHCFYVTNFRVISELKFFTEKENALSYDKINNVVLERPLLGVIFNFGTVLPITGSGLGMGEDFAAVTGGVGATGGGRFAGVGVTGGQTVGVPRSRSAYALYGVPNPKEVYDVVNKYMHEFVEAPYLKEMLGELKGMREDNEEE